MLQIRLNKGSSSDGGVGAKSLPGETVTVACPDHLVLADLPVAKGLGSANSASSVKIIGRRSRRQLADRVHFCLQCDFPIAIYGRLSPCDHAFCLDCARSNSICYLCDERIQKIQTIKMLEGIFICAAPHCFTSFLKKTEFESHIYSCHADLARLSMKKEDINEPEESGAKPSSTLDTTLRGPARPFPSPSNPQSSDREDKGRRLQPPLRSPMQPKPPQWQANPSEPPSDHWPMGMQQQHPDTQGGMQPEFGHFPDKQQQGILPDPHRSEYPPLYSQQPPNFPMMMPPPPFGFSPFPSDGAPPFYGAPVSFEVARSDPAQEGGTEQGFGPGPGGPANFLDGYSRPWNGGPTNIPFEVNQGGQGILGTPQGMGPPPPPPGPPPLMSHHKNNFFSGNANNDGKDYGWQSDRRDSFTGSQD